MMISRRGFLSFTGATIPAILSISGLGLFRIKELLPSDDPTIETIVTELSNEILDDWISFKKLAELHELIVMDRNWIIHMQQQINDQLQNQFPRIFRKELICSTRIDTGRGHNYHYNNHEYLIISTHIEHPNTQTILMIKSRVDYYHLNDYAIHRPDTRVFDLNGEYGSGGRNVRKDLPTSKQWEKWILT